MILEAADNGKLAIPRGYCLGSKIWYIFKSHPSMLLLVKQSGLSAGNACWQKSQRGKIMKRIIIAVMVLAFALVLGGDRAVMAQTSGGERTVYDPPDKDAGNYTKFVIDDKEGHIVSQDDYRDNRLTRHTIYENGHPVHGETYRYDNGNKEIWSFEDYSYYPNGNQKEMTRHTSYKDRKEDELRQFNEDGL
jgi:hypothetical protein